jgi:O-antigen ligase
VNPLPLEAEQNGTRIENPAAAAKAIKPSWWLWVPWVWMFFAATRTPSTWLMGSSGKIATEEVGTGNPIDRLIMTSLMALGLIVLGLRWEQTKRILVRNKWVVALFLFMGLSMIWSNYPAITFRRYNRSVGTLEMALVVLTERNTLEAIRALLRRLFLVHVTLSVATVKYFRHIGVGYDYSGNEEQWIGLTTDKNSLGQVVSSSGLFYIWQILQDWRARQKKRGWAKLAMNMGLLLMSLWLLRGSKSSHSSTAIVGFFLCTAIFVGLQFIKKRQKRARQIFLAVAIASALLAPFIYFAAVVLDVSPVKMMVAATGRDMTFTDRTLIWSDVLNDTADSRVLGVGLGAFWIGPIGYAKYPLPNWSLKTPGWRPEEGHNGFVDVCAELGVVGLILMLVVIGMAYAGTIKELETDFEFGSLRLIMLTIVVTNNLTETSFLKGTHFMWFLFLLVAINVPRAPRQILKSQGKSAAATDATWSAWGHDAGQVIESEELPVPAAAGNSQSLSALSNAASPRHA